MPPRRNTPRKGRGESPSTSMAGSAGAHELPAAESLVSTPPRRTTRARRATTKATGSASDASSAATSSKSEGAPSTSTSKSTVSTTTPSSSLSSSPSKTPQKARASKATPSSQRTEPAERVHELPKRTNPRLHEVKSRQVKLQVIRREDKYVCETNVCAREIIIGRIKLPTVNGAEHGFLLKRFDTNAIAGSSMFRLAFPYADAEEESAEMTYLESRFDTDVANGGVIPPPRSRSSRKLTSDTTAKAAGTLPPGSTGVRLQGVWIPCEHAMSIANDYGLVEYAQPLIEATAILLPDEDAPVLNPDAETLATAAAASSSAVVETTGAPTPSDDTSPPALTSSLDVVSSNALSNEAALGAADSPMREPLQVAEKDDTNRSAVSDVTKHCETPPQQADLVVPTRQKKRARVGEELQASSALSSNDNQSDVATNAEAVLARSQAARRSGRTAPTAASTDVPAPSVPLTAAQIDAQIREAQDFAAKIQRESMQHDETHSRPTKRLAEDDEQEDPHSVTVAPQASSQVLRRRRPLARAAGMLTAAGAMGIGAMAVYTGSINLPASVPHVFEQLQHVDYSSALQVIQQNIQNWGIASWFG